MFFKFMLAVISILVLMIVFAIIDDRRSRRADTQVQLPGRVHIAIPVPEPEARECPTTDFYIEAYDNLLNYAEELAEELREEPA